MNQIDIYQSVFFMSSNPGSFPFNLSPHDYIEKDMPSMKWNPLILDTLFRCKDVEKAGTGFKRMSELCKENC